MGSANLGKSPWNKQQHTTIKCSSCSNNISVTDYDIKRNRKSCSRICASKLRDKGRTTEAFRLRTSNLYKQWRTAVFERDEYTCQVCFSIGGKLNADHIKRFSDFPELRLDVNNGRTLCVPCHLKTATFGNRKQNIISNGVKT